MPDFTTALMQKAARRLTKTFPDLHFVLIVGPFAAPNITNYISNGQRPECITMLRETADRLERNQDKPVPQGS